MTDTALHQEAAELRRRLEVVEEQLAPRLPDDPPAPNPNSFAGLVGAAQEKRRQAWREELEDRATARVALEAERDRELADLQGRIDGLKARLAPVEAAYEAAVAPHFACFQQAAGPINKELRDLRAKMREVQDRPIIVPETLSAPITGTYDHAEPGRVGRFRRHRTNAK